MGVGGSLKWRLLQSVRKIHSSGPKIQDLKKTPPRFWVVLYKVVRIVFHRSWVRFVTTHQSTLPGVMRSAGWSSPFLTARRELPPPGFGAVAMALELSPEQQRGALGERTGKDD